jgi:hypothetical protein
MIMQTKKLLFICAGVALGCGVAGFFYSKKKQADNAPDSDAAEQLRLEIIAEANKIIAQDTAHPGMLSNQAVKAIVSGVVGTAGGALLKDKTVPELTLILQKLKALETVSPTSLSDDKNLRYSDVLAQFSGDTIKTLLDGPTSQIPELALS